jgi:ABC-type multidrug transport system fused ATPase/permease subunit
MPALQQIFRGLAQIRFFLPALDNLRADLRSAVAESQAQGTASAIDAIGYEREILLDGVCYGYPGGDRHVIIDITLEIPKNTSVAFVGSTGSGKTTLVDILLGLLEPQRGSVRVDGVALSSANMSAWRKRVGYVPQHIYLCDDSVTKNVAFGVPDTEVNHAAVERAVRVAHLHDFIASLPHGYDTVVGEHGVRLSGGQRQRIGIARALYHDPDVLIMDEATSALDGITEDTVIRAIRDLARQKTIVLVAHRLTTVRDCDAIYLFERGEMVATGTYDELMLTSVKFRGMAGAAIEPAGAA